MSLKYEGAGIELDITCILRSLLCLYYQQGNTTIEIPRTLLMKQPWREMRLTSTFNSDGTGHVVTIHGPQPILEAEYEIVEEPTALPPAQKLLSNADRDK